MGNSKIVHTTTCTCRPNRVHGNHKATRGKNTNKNNRFEVDNNRIWLPAKKKESTTNQSIHVVVVPVIAASRAAASDSSTRTGAWRVFVADCRCRESWWRWPIVRAAVLFLLLLLLAELWHRCRCQGQPSLCRRWRRRQWRRAVLVRRMLMLLLILENDSSCEDELFWIQSSYCSVWLLVLLLL